MIHSRFLLHIAALFIAASSFTACNDDDSFSSSPGNLLTFKDGKDTLSLDTIFSTIPSPHKQMVVYNNSGDGIRINAIRLQGANQTGFRVNVNGTYLSDASGYTVRDMELRKGDSLRVFLEMTSHQGHDTLPRLVSDRLVFSLESGVQQTLHLNAWTWDANVLRDYVVSKDRDTIRNEHGMPVVVFGNIKVDSLKTLVIDPGTTVYFHSNSGIDVYGTLKIDGRQDKEVTLRSDRLDRMVSNLMYDNNPGQWGSIRLRPSSLNNTVEYTDIHAGTTGFLCDSMGINSDQKLTLSHSTIHNMRGNGIKSQNCNITINNSQISNTYRHCLSFTGGKVDMTYSTVAQYYPFDANREFALHFANAVDTIPFPLTLNVKNSIIKGYADDVILWSRGALNEPIDAHFDHCLLRTPCPEDDDAKMFEGSVYENIEDTLTNGRNFFTLFDTDYFFYDFRPKAETLAIGTAEPLVAFPDDRKGKTRHTEKPDLGCYESDK